MSSKLSVTGMMTVTAKLISEKSLKNLGNARPQLAPGPFLSWHLLLTYRFVLIGVCEHVNHFNFITKFEIQAICPGLKLCEF